DFVRGDHVFRERVPQPVIVQKRIEWPRLVGAERKHGSLCDDALVERRGLEKTCEVALRATPHQYPRSEVPVLTEQLVEVLDQQRERREFELLVQHLPVETPHGAVLLLVPVVRSRGEE